MPKWFGQVFGGCIHECQQKFLEQSYTHFSSVRPWCLWSCRNSLHVVHSVESLHVVRMVESHICTNRIGVHLERVHPLMKLSNNFRCRCTLHRQAVKCDVAPSKSEIRRFCLQSLLTHDLKRNSSGRRPLTRDPVSVLRNCRTGMSSPLVDEGLNFFQEYPGESSSS